MGLEEREEDGIQPEDIIKALQGHVKEGYKVEKRTNMFEFQLIFNLRFTDQKTHNTYNIYRPQSTDVKKIMWCFKVLSLV